MEFTSGLGVELEGHLVRLGRSDAEFRRNAAHSFRRMVELLLDWYPRLCPIRLGGGAEVVTEPTVVDLPEKSPIQRVVGSEKDAVAAEALFVRHRLTAPTVASRQSERFDVVRETGLRILCGATTGFRGASQFRTILFRVALNVIDKWRKSLWREFAVPAAQGCGQWSISIWAERTGRIYG